MLLVSWLAKLPVLVGVGGGGGGNENGNVYNRKIIGYKSGPRSFEDLIVCFQAVHE